MNYYERAVELKDEIVTSARRITNEVLVNAKDSINKALDNVISDMVLSRLKPSK